MYGLSATITKECPRAPQTSKRQSISFTKKTFRIMRITNLTSGFRLKETQAQDRVSGCVSCWHCERCDFEWMGPLPIKCANPKCEELRPEVWCRFRTVRDMNYHERLAALSLQQRAEFEATPLPWAEIPGLCVQNIPHIYEERQLAREANLFCENSA